MNEIPDLPQSPYFEIEVLADGVYAAMARNRGAASNAGIVDLGGGALIFDTFMTPQAAEDLCNTAERLAHAPVRYVVNSHWHGDHINGNAVFRGAVSLISTTRTRTLIEKNAPGAMRSLRQQRPQLETELHDLQLQLETTSDEEARRSIQQDIQNHLIMIDAIPSLKLRLPDWTFEQQVTLHGSTRTAELITFGGGHTDSDAILFLPDAGIAFVADLLFNGQHPWMGHGHPEAWLGILDDLDGLGAGTIVPGHGPVGTPEAFDQMRAYIPAIQQIVVGLLDSEPPEAPEGEEIDIMAGVEIPEAFQPWEGGQRFANNIRALYARGRAPSGKTTAGH